jgi:hypothetical protein
VDLQAGGPAALELYCHEVSVRFLEEAIVPPYEGSMIRGAFGRAFKESAAPSPTIGAGAPWEINAPTLMSSRPRRRKRPGTSPGTKRSRDPTSFEPPEGTKMEHEPGERMSFGFTVVGRAAECVRFFRS